MKTYSLIIFDLDGTLYCKDNLLIKTIDNRIKDFIINNTNELFDIIKFEKMYPNIVKALDILNIDRKIFCESIYSSIDYNAYLSKDIVLKKFLNSLQCKKVVVSLSPRYHIKSVLYALGVKNQFIEKYSIYDYDMSDKQDLYSKIIDEYSLDKDSVLVIGDSYENDIIPAIRLGTDYKYITRGIEEIYSYFGFK